jgi:NADH dehydrogenase [ubiquinone] 1 alpha subcomplex assembly factor 7
VGLEHGPGIVVAHGSDWFGRIVAVAQDRMTPLEEIIQRRIIQTGPVTVADYMDLCLAHPQYGYYHNRDPFGVNGDFTTAPEISQMFGELIGLWLAQVWVDQGMPTPFVLAELGPGRGSLMSDAMRAIRNIPGFHQAAQIWLVETSPVLRRKQAENVVGANWAFQVDELPNLPLFLIANEFFDALPICQFVRKGGGWNEKRIGLVDGNLIWGFAPTVTNTDLDLRFPDLADGELAETCMLGEQIAAHIGDQITRNGGAALIIDYGEWFGVGDTLQALRGHKMVDPLLTPGEADLTAHVNFSTLALASDLQAWPLQTQGEFLERLGISHRAEILGRTDPKTIAAAHHRLTHSTEMGSLFKVLCLTRNDAPTPPGFAP